MASKPCPTCGGSGYSSFQLGTLGRNEACRSCGGTGRITVPDPPPRRPPPPKSKEKTIGSARKSTVSVGGMEAASAPPETLTEEKKDERFAGWLNLAALLGTPALAYVIAPSSP